LNEIHDLESNSSFFANIGELNRIQRRIWVHTLKPNKRQLVDFNITDKIRIYTGNNFVPFLAILGFCTVIWFTEKMKEVGKTTNY